jgi:hypothetical protein
MNNTKANAEIIHEMVGVRLVAEVGRKIGELWAKDCRSDSWAIAL